MKRVTIYRHHLFFTVSFRDGRDAQFVSLLCHHLTSYDVEWNKYSKRYVRKPGKKYYIYDEKTKTFRFPIKQIRNFMISLRDGGFTKDEIEIINVENKNIAELNLSVNKKYTLRDYQEEYKNIVVNGSESIYLIDAKVGSGKGLTSCAALCELNMRTVILVLPKFVEKWKKDALEYTNVKEDEIITIQGGNSLLNLMTNVNLNDKRIKFIIISLRTLSFYINECVEAGEDSIYPVAPQDLLSHLQVGVIYNDETHSSFKEIATAMLYLDAKKFIGSTATFDSNVLQTRKLYDMIIPPDNRISNLVKRDPYVEGISVRYVLQKSPVIKFTRSQGYNHNLYEQSLMRSRVGMINYEKMILHYVDKYYINKKQPGDRCLIFFASIEFCSHFTRVLQERYQDLNVTRYVESDGYDNIMSADICCSTVLKAGTGMDIHNLITVIQTISIFSLQSNIQSFGRLRKIEDKTTRFIWFWTADIYKQIKLHRERLRLLMPEFKEYIEEEYQPVIKTR